MTHKIIRKWKKGKIKVFLRCDEIGSHRHVADFYDGDMSRRFCIALRRKLGQGYLYDDQLPEKRKAWSL